MTLVQRSKQIFLFGFLVCILLPNFLFAASKEEVLEKYEHIVIKTNELSIYGYDLKDTGGKLKRLTSVLLDNQFDRADQMLDELKKELYLIEASGPERIQQERRLAWLEIFADFAQQLALFVILSLILFRFQLVKYAFREAKLGWQIQLRLAAIFTACSLVGGSLSLIRYGQSSWSFIDLQILFVGISGFIGGIVVGLITGILGGVFRIVIAPEALLLSSLPLILGALSGICSYLCRIRPIRRKEAILGGIAVGLGHSLFIFIPLRSYIPIASLIFSVFTLSAVEAAVVLLFFVIGWNVLKEEKRKATEQELYRTRLQFLQAQINPHFLFNTLNTIAAVCGEERAEKARNLVVQLSNFFRRLTRQESDFVSLKEELDYIDSYLSIEKARFGDRLKIEKDVQLSDQAMSVAVPILSLQPLVENAIKHGLSKKSGGGTLYIKGRQENSDIIIEIEDTGVGMSEEMIRRFEANGNVGQSLDEHAGIGLSNIRERLKKNFGERFQMHLSSMLNQGTQIQLKIKTI